MFEWRISSLIFSGGETIALEPASVTLLIGPNNSGKSTALEEIKRKINSETNVKVITDVQMARIGTDDDFLAWADKRYSCYVIDGQKNYFTIGIQTTEGGLRNLWNFPSAIYQNGPSRFFISSLSTHARLEIGNPVQASLLYQSAPGQYIHLLQQDEALLNKVSGEVRRAFGKDLIINRGGAGQVWFHVGDEPTRTRDRDRVSFEYLRELNSLPRLADEGDGIRSFVSTLLAALCGAQPLLLIDEPEAFLHPAQAERLAGILAESAKTLRRQVIVATHSSAVVRGVLNKSGTVAVCRLTREGSVNHACLLSSSDLKSLWAKPLLRSADAIEGLFSEGVIVCEADTDRRFYEAVLKRLEEQGTVPAPVDFYSVNGGGKGDLATLAQAYTRLNVRTVVIADFDLLRQEGEFKNVIRALGGDFSHIAGQYKSVASELNNQGPIKPVDEFLTEAQAILEKIKSAKAVATQDISALTNLMNNSKTWSEAKRYGITKLRGGAHTTCQDLLTWCRSIGLFLVPKGEMESWWLEGPASDKMEWFNQAIEEISTNSASFAEASKFMEDVYHYLKGQAADEAAAV